MDYLTPLEDRIKFWNVLRPWFQIRGYDIYDCIYYEGSSLDRYEKPRTPAKEKQHQHHPYAPFIVDVGDSGYTAPFSGRHVRAQDSKQRHVVIKCVRSGSGELKTLQILRQSSDVLEDEVRFPCVIPVLDILQYDDNYTFVVFPRWGDQVHSLEWFNHIYEILDLMHSMLKGLVFLHEHRIFHRAVCHANHMVANHFSYTWCQNNELRQLMRKERRLLYAFSNFDLAIVFPSDTSLLDCRLPVREATRGVFDCPHGVLNGETDCNPFAYDVGCLGVYFCNYFQQLTGNIPMLAPLMDGMATPNINARMTAAEALAFFESNREDIDPRKLALYPIPIIQDHWSSYDRWSSLPVDLQEKWSSYRISNSSLAND